MKKVLIGVDEVGRGCLAGNVTAVAFCALSELPIGLNDSKKLSAKKRNEYFEILTKSPSYMYGIGTQSVEEVDTYNILQSTFRAMHIAIEYLIKQLEVKETNYSYKLLIDGNKFIPYKNIPFECIVRGDGKIPEISAASIIAKVTRDSVMNELHTVHPQYDWKNNKGYGTAKHRNAIKQYGRNEHHRKSFHLKEDQLKFDF